MVPRTMKAVLGLRHIKTIGDKELHLEFGASWGNFEPTTFGFEIYSPDDDNYPYNDFVHPTEVEVITESDVIIPMERHSSYQIQTHVYLTLPHEMKEGNTYYVRALGGLPVEGNLLEEYHNCAPWFGWRLTDEQNARGVTFGEDKREVTDAVVESVMGLRGIHKVSPTIYRIRIGSAVEETELRNTELFDINGIHPSSIHQMSEAEATLPGLNGIYPFTVRLQHHDLYLVLEASPLEDGKGTITVSDSILGGRNSLSFTDSSLRNPHIHVNQEGYFPEITEKRAIFGA